MSNCHPLAVCELLSAKGDIRPANRPYVHPSRHTDTMASSRALTSFLLPNMELNVMVSLSESRSLFSPPYLNMRSFGTHKKRDSYADIGVT